MIDIALLIGRLLLIALLYLFLLMVVRTGVGLVKGQRRRGNVWSVAVEKGPKELRGVKIDVTGPVVVGRSPGADIVVGTDYASSRHARFTPVGKDLVLEDLGSLNGTYLNGQPLMLATGLKPGDIVGIGDVEIRVDRS